VKPIEESETDRPRESGESDREEGSTGSDHGLDSGSSAEAESAEERADSRKPRKRGFFLTAVVVFFRLVVTLALLVSSFLAGIAGGVVWHFVEQVSVFEPRMVQHLEMGALVIDARGQPIGRAGGADRWLVDYESLPPHFLEALVAAEDQRFFEHRGFDPLGMARATVVNYRAGEIREGASTLTQQLARNAFGLEGRSIYRKVLEIFLAVKLELHYSKEEIVEHYLNRVYWGSGADGLGAAALIYFAKPPSGLTVGESALLSGIIRSPSTLSPFVDRSAALDRRDAILRRMHHQGYLDAGELERELAEDLDFADSPAETMARQQRKHLLLRAAKESRDLVAFLASRRRSAVRPRRPLCRPRC